MLCCDLSDELIVWGDAREAVVRSLRAEENNGDVTFFKIGEFFLGGTEEDDSVAAPSGGEFDLFHFAKRVEGSLDPPRSVDAHIIDDSAKNWKGVTRPRREANTDGRVAPAL